MALINKRHLQSDKEYLVLSEDNTAQNQTLLET